jgi:hypothetical protein
VHLWSCHKLSKVSPINLEACGTGLPLISIFKKQKKKFRNSMSMHVWDTCTAAWEVYLGKLAAWTLIILFSEMLMFSPPKTIQRKKKL